MDRTNVARFGLVLMVAGILWGAVNFVKKKPQKHAAIMLGAGALLLVWVTRPGLSRSQLEDWTLLTLRQGGIWWTGASLLAAMMGGRARLEVLEDEREALAKDTAAGAQQAQVEAAAAAGAQVGVELATQQYQAILPVAPVITYGTILDAGPGGTAPAIAPGWVTDPYQINATRTNTQTTVPFDGAAQYGAASAAQTLALAQQVARMEALARELAAAAAASAGGGGADPRSAREQELAARYGDEYAARREAEMRGYGAAGEQAERSASRADTLTPLTPAPPGYAPAPTPIPIPTKKARMSGGSDIERAKNYTLSDPRFAGQTPAVGRR